MFQERGLLPWARCVERRGRSRPVTQLIPFPASPPMRADEVGLGRQRAQMAFVL